MTEISLDIWLAELNKFERRAADKEGYTFGELKAAWGTTDYKTRKILKTAKAMNMLISFRSYRVNVAGEKSRIPVYQFKKLESQQ